MNYFVVNYAICVHSVQQLEMDMFMVVMENYLFSLSVTDNYCVC